MITKNEQSEREILAENGNMHGSFKTYQSVYGPQQSPINATGGGWSASTFIDLYLNENRMQLELIPHVPKASYGDFPRISYATHDKEGMIEFLTNLRDALTTILEIHEAI